MKIVISGIGMTGYYLTEILLKEGHDLILIERDEKKYKYAQERLDAQIVLGDGSDALILEPLIDENTDLFVSVTANDNANILSSLIARRFGAKRVICRVGQASNLIHPLLTDDPFVSVINAEMAVARDLARLVGNPLADEIEFFANGKAEMLKLHVSENASVISKPLREAHVPTSWIVIAMTRKGAFSIVDGDTILEAGDHVLVLGDPEKSQEIEEVLGLEPVKVKRAILIGYNEISARLAQGLKNRDIDVRLIEENRELAEKAAAALDDVLVLQGDGTSAELLEQAGIADTDYLIALTSDDENNVLITLLAKEKQVHRVIALAQKPQYKSIIEKIGVDSVLSPRAAVVDEIIRSIYHEDFMEVSILEGGNGCMIELAMKRKNKMVDTPFSKLKLPKQTLIGAIIRDKTLIIPHGENRIQVGDHIVVFTKRSMLSEVKQAFVG